MSFYVLFQLLLLFRSVINLSLTASGRCDVSWGWINEATMVIPLRNPSKTLLAQTGVFSQNEVPGFNCSWILSLLLHAFALLDFWNEKTQPISDSGDEYAYGIPNPKHTPKCTKAEVPHTQDKYTQLSSFIELCCCLCHPIKSLAAPSLPENVDTHSLRTGYLRP